MRPPASPAGGGDPLLGKVLGGCRLEKMLGRGAMGAVYLARQEKLDRDVAVKVIRPEMMTDARMLKRFEVEARTVGKFNSAHVVMVHDVGFDLGVHYLVMEFVQGKNLRDHVKLLAGGRLPVGEALPLLRQAIKGLEEAQRLKVIHRDIKPDNLMLTDRGMLKIADFGIAKPLQDDFSMTLTSELVGTPLYMSPEQCQGHAELDFRSDMYSLGATFYYLLTGEPPIRASSVYELIQTKTKLAHLCLWKALPGLDENNPLSRVIERMTALDRDDRYESYEALLNDLVLVEHGQTVHVDKAGGGARARGKAAKGGKGAVVAAVAVLLLGGGAAAWYATRPQPPVVEPAERVREQLAALRVRLRTEGPTDTLWADLGRVAAPAELADAHQQLRTEAEAARTLRQALAPLATPKALALPFDDLRTYLAAVDAAVAAHPVAGDDAVAWRDSAVAAARNESVLGSLALTELATAFATWGDDRARAGGDAKAIGALDQRLRDLETARGTLLTLLPSVTAAVDERLPAERLAVARRELSTAPTGPVDADLGAALDECRALLASKGPTQELFDRIDKLGPTRQDQIDRRGALLNDFEKARRASSEASSVRTTSRPEPPRPPFDDVARYWQALDRAFDPVRAADGSLPAWAQAMRAELRAETTLREQVLTACGQAFAKWRDAGTAAPAGELVALRTARTTARGLFRGAEAAIDAAIPEPALAAGEAAAARVGQRQPGLADAEALSRRIAAVASLADWATVASACDEQATALRGKAAGLAGEADVTRELGRLDAALERWRLAASRLRDIDQKLAAAEVRGAEVLAKAGAAGAEGRAEFQLAVETIAAIDATFAALARTLAVDDAVAALATAREKLRTTSGLAGAEQRLVRWGEALQALRAATVGMVGIPAGRAKGSGAAVDGFFLAATECSRAEFAAFVAGLRTALEGKTKEQYLATVGERLAGSGITVERLEGLIARSDRNDKLPIEGITWFSAAACAAWQGRALPTADEWTLAAFGDGGAQAFPWGGTWSNESAQRNPGTAAVEVDSGGLSWRSAGAARLHHLAGNVAEWLAGDPAQPEARLAGGRYNDTSLAVSRERASGAFETTTNDDSRRGYGFRTVVRVRGFPGLDWPR